MCVLCETHSQTPVEPVGGLMLTTVSVSFSATYSLSGEGNPDSED